MSDKTVVVIDSNNSLYRFFHKFPPRVSDGERVESAAGVVDEAIRFSKAANTELVVSVFDANGTNWRHDIYPDYKAERKGMPDELKTQEILAQEALKAAGMPVIVKEGFEADDSIGMVCDKYVDLGFNVLISTTDKDMAQLVSDKVSVFNPITNTKLDIEGVVKKFGVTPDLIPDFLALKGDKEDNVIGVQGVGDKTAAKLLNEYSGLQGVIDNAESIKGAVGKKIQAAVDRLPLNLTLTKVDRDYNKLTEAEVLMLESPTHDVVKCLDYSDRYRLKLPTQKPGIESVVKPSATPEPEQGSLF